MSKEKYWRIWRTDVLNLLEFMGRPGPTETLISSQPMIEKSASTSSRLFLLPWGLLESQVKVRVRLKAPALFPINLFLELYDTLEIVFKFNLLQ